MYILKGKGVKMKTHITVFGSVAVDLTSRAGHLPKPGETVVGTSFAIGPGGKGSNQGVAVYRAGAEVSMVTKVGNDIFGRMILDFYRGEGMRTDFVFYRSGSRNWRIAHHGG